MRNTVLVLASMTLAGLMACTAAVLTAVPGNRVWSVPGTHGDLLTSSVCHALASSASSLLVGYEDLR